MTKTMHLYFEALRRLQEDNPIVVPKGTRISNDSVSLEAARKKGSIKRSRPEFAELIAAIKEAQDPMGDLATKSGEQAPQNVKNSEVYRVKYEMLLAERAGVILEAFRQREEISAMRASLTARATELENYVELTRNLEAELARLQGGKLRSIPHSPANEDE